MMEILYFRGPKALYNQSAHKDGIYFAIDTQEIIHNGLIFSGKIPQELVDKIYSNSAKLEVLNESSIQTQIDASINDFANKLSDDGTINTFKELVDYVSENGKELGTLITDLESVKESNKNIESEIVSLKTEKIKLSEQVEKNSTAIENMSISLDQKIESAFSWQDVN